MPHCAGEDHPQRRQTLTNTKLTVHVNKQAHPSTRCLLARVSPRVFCPRCCSATGVNSAMLCDNSVSMQFLCSAVFRYPQLQQLLPPPSTSMLTPLLTHPHEGLEGQLAAVSIHIQELMLPGGDHVVMERPRIANYVAAYRLPGRVPSGVHCACLSVGCYQLRYKRPRLAFCVLVQLLLMLIHPPGACRTRA